MINLKGFYQSNERFRAYVDRFAASRGVPAEDILRLALTREVAQSYIGDEQGPRVASTYAPIGECV